LRLFAPHWRDKERLLLEGERLENPDFWSFLLKLRAEAFKGWGESIYTKEEKKVLCHIRAFVRRAMARDSEVLAEGADVGSNQVSQKRGLGGGVMA